MLLDLSQKKIKSENLGSGNFVRESQEVTEGGVITYNLGISNRFILRNRLTAFSGVFKRIPSFYTTTLPRDKHSIYTRLFYSTRSKLSLARLEGSSVTSKPAVKGKSYDFFKKIYSDKSANNPFFIVKNFLEQYPCFELAKININYKLINTILGNFLKDFQLSEESFNFLIKLTKDQPIIFDELPLSKEGKNHLQSILGVTKRGVNSKPGVYIFINKITGERYVGSSIALASRLNDDYLRKGKNLGNRPIELAINRYGLANFKLQVFVLSQELLRNIYPKNDFSLTSEEEGILPRSLPMAADDPKAVEVIKKEIRNLVLVLEQIFILLYNPEYNKLKVAGSVAGNKKDKELMETVFEKRRKITYLYDQEKKELIYIANSRTLLSEVLGLKRRLIPNQLYLNKFFISDELLVSSCDEIENGYTNNLLSSNALAASIKRIRQDIMEKTSRNFLPYKEVVREKLSKPTVLIHTITKEEKVFPSLNAVALYLRELNSEYKASSGSLHNIMKRGGLYKGIFLVRYLENNEGDKE